MATGAGRIGSGADLLLELTGTRAAIAAADVVVTGGGTLGRPAGKWQSTRRRARGGTKCRTTGHLGRG